MDATAARQRLSDARVACLGTAGANGRPHLVPVVFAVDGDMIYFAVDAKPKRTTNLQRLRNIAANPEVSLLVDHYMEDWTLLWWVRVDGTARVVDDAAQAGRALDLLAGRYPQYRQARPRGPVVAIAIRSITGWAAADNPAR
jgi:PPOX class probable F420-dependent enzyme